MDFRQSNTTPVQKSEHPAVAVADSTQTGRASAARFGMSSMPKWLNILSVVILFSITILLLLLALLLARGQSGVANESSQVDSTKYQAVFLNNGQVYFGDITEINGRYVRLNNIYYLTQATTTAANGQQQASSDYTLIKLGCQQIHYPTDQMLISRDQVTFWENLNKDGKVAKSIEDFKKKYPNGPDCSQVSNETQSTTNTNTQGSNTPTNTTTNNANR